MFFFPPSPVVLDRLSAQRPKNEVIHLKPLTLQLKLSTCTNCNGQMQAIIAAAVESVHHPLHHPVSLKRLKSATGCCKRQNEEKVSARAPRENHVHVGAYDSFQDAKTRECAPHLKTLPAFQQNSSALSCVHCTGICKLSKLQMIACCFLATKRGIKSTMSWFVCRLESAFFSFDFSLKKKKRHKTRKNSGILSLTVFMYQSGFDSFAIQEPSAAFDPTKLPTNHLGKMATQRVTLAQMSCLSTSESSKSRCPEWAHLATVVRG